jgi:hypothetical protein
MFQFWLKARQIFGLYNPVYGEINVLGSIYKVFNSVLKWLFALRFFYNRFLA